jgi:hypothetical protein
MARRQESYTESEIAAFDAGFEAATHVARAEAMKSMLSLDVDPRVVSLVLKDLHSGMNDWIRYQQERD